MRHAGAVLAATLLIAGCSGGEGGNNSSAGASATQEEEPMNLTKDPGNMAVPVTLPSPSPIAAIPAAFRGRWGMTAADCDPAKADVAKGLLVVTGDRLSFYESRGSVRDLRDLGPDRVGFTLAMSGEGQDWSEPTTLTVREGGRTLLREASGSRDRAGAFTYQKCPG